MRRVRYRVAASLDGYIAGPNGEIDWIVADPDVDFASLYAEFDTVLLGRCMYELTLQRSQHCERRRLVSRVTNPTRRGGLWSLDLGLVTTSQECLPLPPTAVFRVIGEHEGGGADTTNFTWMNANSLSLGAQPPSSSQIVASPSTTTFVPADAAGWQITVPGGAQPTSTSACTP